MRKFKVLKCPTQKTHVRTASRRDDNGNLVHYQSYSVVKTGEIPPGRKEPWYPAAYGVEKVKKGDIIELKGHFADKAAANPDFEEVFEAVETVKKKRGRPRKVA